MKLKKEKKIICKKKAIIILFIFISVVAVFCTADPYGASLDVGDSSRRTSPDSSNVTAGGGNVTPITADLSQITETWQGYYGTVQGGIYLGNAAGDTFYDWNVADAIGEILATRNSVSDWTIINCTNQTEIYDEEARLNIPEAASDGINDTYYTISPSFDIAGRTLNGCPATLTNNETDSKLVFWNVLLNTNESNTVYTVIMENNKPGFNGSIVDFQIFVPVDRNTGLATYFIYVEQD
ncbi:MAG: hypothetical protein V1859_00340 [archaeon]